MASVCSLSASLCEIGKAETTTAAAAGDATTAAAAGAAITAAAGGASAASYGTGCPDAVVQNCIAKCHMKFLDDWNGIYAQDPDSCVTTKVCKSVFYSIDEIKHTV